MTQTGASAASTSLPSRSASKTATYARGGPRPQPGTLNQLLFEAVEKYNKPDALQVRIGDRYTPISHAVLLERIRNVSYGLREIGIRRGDRVAILSENRPEWAIADFACLTSGITDVPLYPSGSPVVTGPDFSLRAFRSELLRRVEGDGSLRELGILLDGEVEVAEQLVAHRRLLLQQLLEQALGGGERHERHRLRSRWPSRCSPGTPASSANGW